MLPLPSFEEFLTARLSFSFCRGTKQKRSNLRHTRSQKSICQQTWVWSRLHAWYRKSKAAAETQHSAEVRGLFAVRKMGQEETAIIRSLKNLIYASPGCRAFFPAACSVSRLADPSSVPIAGSTRDGELQEDRGAKRRKRQRHQQPWQQQPVVPPESLVEQRGWGNMLWMSFGGNSIPDRHAKLVMDPQDQRLPLGDCPLRAA